MKKGFFFNPETLVNWRRRKSSMHPLPLASSSKKSNIINQTFQELGENGLRLEWCSVDEGLRRIRSYFPLLISHFMVFFPSKLPTTPEPTVAPERKSVSNPLAKSLSYKKPLSETPLVSQDPYRKMLPLSIPPLNCDKSLGTGRWQAGSLWSRAGPHLSKEFHIGKDFKYQVN